MNSITSNKLISYKTDYNINENKNQNNNNKHTDESSNSITFKGTDDSNISSDGMLGYKFLKRIETSMQDSNKTPSISKYTSEYEKIKKEILSGSYGSDTDKYIDLLNNTFKNALTNTSNFLLKSSTKTSNIKMSASTLIQCQKQHDTATSLVWIFKSENKRILKEIEAYKKKKNHRMVASLTQLSDTYKHVINNISNTVTLIESNINDSLNANSNEPVNSDKLIEPQNMDK
jgi:hypothetical protein